MASNSWVSLIQPRRTTNSERNSATMTYPLPNRTAPMRAISRSTVSGATASAPLDPSAAAAVVRTLPPDARPGPDARLSADVGALPDAMSVPDPSSAPDVARRSRGPDTDATAPRAG